MAMRDGSALMRTADLVPYTATRLTPSRMLMRSPTCVLAKSYTSPWVAELLGRSAVASPDERPARHHRQVHLPAQAPFSAPETHTVQWSLAVTAPDLVEFACTYSRFIVLPESDKVRLRAGLTDLAAGHPALAGGGEIDLPMRCLCWRAVRQG